MVTFKLVKKAAYKVVGDMKVSSREGMVISYLDEAPDLDGMSSKLVCEGQIYNYSSSVFDSWNAIVINSPDSFVGKVIRFIPEEKPKMTEEELEGLRKEIVRQMGVKSMEEAYLRGDWAKVDPELMNKYKEYAVPQIRKTMENMR